MTRKYPKCSIPDCSNVANYEGKRCKKHALPKSKIRIKQCAYNYEKTIKGFLMRAYRNMKSRVTGIQKKKFYLYQGKELLAKESFYSWSKSNMDFLRLYKEWASNNYDQKLTPSVNRINSNKGYTLDNMEWITNSQNSALSSVTKKLKRQDKQTIYKILGVGESNEE